jgi:hypothetical protein
VLVSERVTNSARHAQLTRDATIRVGVAIVGGLVRFEVEELSDGAIGAAVPDREHGGGFGLYLVEIFAEWWIPATTAMRVCWPSAQSQRRRNRPMTARLVVALIAR